MAEGIGGAILQPAAVLSLLVGAFSTSAFLVIVGRIGWHTLVTFALATLGAWVGNALLGPGTILRLGDYSLFGAAIGSWVAIAAVEVADWYRVRGRDDAAPAGSGIDGG